MKFLNAFILFLLLVSSALVLGGALLANNQIYYLVLLPLIAAGLLEIGILSYNLQSAAVFLCILNTALAVVLAILKLSIGFPILVASDKSFGAIIIALYLIDMGTYAALFFRNRFRNWRVAIAIAILGIGPAIGMSTFYAGLEAWAGLAIIIVSCLLALQIIYQYININSNNSYHEN